MSSWNDIWSPSQTELWSAVDRLISLSRDVAGLRAHGLHLIAAQTWRQRGQAVPAQVVSEERLSTMAVLTVPTLLTQIRSIVDSPIILIKGPEVASLYPDPALRPFSDLDILVRDSAAAQRALCAAGFKPLGNPLRYRGHHHLQPLNWPGSPLLIEVHCSPGWLRWMHPPTIDELFTAAIPSSTGVDGVLTLPRLHHCLLLAAHSWQHGPLPRLLDFIDIALMAEGVEAADLARHADRWGFGRVWRTTMQALHHIIQLNDERPWPLRFWARHLLTVRERTALEARAARWFVGGLWAPSVPCALDAIISTIGHDIQPWPQESWGIKLRRMRRSVGSAFDPVSRGKQTPDETSVIGHK